MLHWLTSYQYFVTLTIAYLRYHIEQKFNIIYRIIYLGCFQKYVGKTNQNLITRLEEHGINVDQPLYQHLRNCSILNDHIMLFTLPDAATNTTIVSKELHLHNAIINNVKIFDKKDKWAQLQFLKHITLRNWHLKLFSV